MEVQSFQDLQVYQRAFELQQRIFELSKRFPKEETYSLTDQVRRSSRSVGANIAEAWRKRNYPAHFASKLSDADAENSETMHWVMTASSCGYLSQVDAELLKASTSAIGAMLGKMISNAASWQPRTANSKPPTAL